MGKRLSHELLDEAAQAASSDADPVSDIHASEEYRRHLIRVLTKRMVNQAWEEAIRLV
jgi:CO/xanthine dehydrogenase FAD-binding subunit